ncbi:MAG: hypothetical protein QOG11_1775 [Solirubrobacteraceae bacterium]|nr:hypothetical protein [Solirubrobacteraceae bacterium]
MLLLDRPQRRPQAPPGTRRLRFRWVALACLALAGASLLFPSSPTYDPWAWIIWGREILHLDLRTTDGPSWKPLPVLFTTPFALTGPDVAPMLWLVVARAGALLALVAAFRVARRLGGTLAGGAAAVGALVIAPWFLRSCALGSSEGMLVACVLGAVDRHLEGRRGQAFALAVAAGLLRPEAWPFLGLYALWLVWEDRARLWSVAAGLALIPLLWFPPELWGSGDLLRAASRARTPRPDSAAFAASPAREVLDNAAGMLTLPLWIGVGCALVLLVARRWGRRDAFAVGVLAATAVAWVGVVAYMTKDGFSGNQRYLIMPVSLALVVAGAGVGRALGQLVRPARGGVGAVVVAAVVAALFALPSVDRVGAVLDGMRYQGELGHQLARAVDASGGAARLRACGDAYTGPFLVPAVAWQLHVHTNQVDLEPRRPEVVFRVRTNPGGRITPSLRRLGSTPLLTLAVTRDWRIVTACR